MSDIFVSYARSNEPQAKEAADRLAAMGYDVWRDDQLPVHRAFGEVIEERLREAKAVLVLWSAEAARSEWVRSEANHAREHRKLVQLTLDGAPLPMPFDQFQCAALHDAAGGRDSAAWSKVLDSIATLVGTVNGARDSPAANERDAGASVRRPLPPRLGNRLDQALFGREAEQAAMKEAWIAARSGHGRVVLLGGEPGIGKTRLAAEIAGVAHADGATVLFGSCDEDVSPPYRPFVDAVRDCVAQASDSTLKHHAQTHNSALARLAPELLERLPGLPPVGAAEAETERFLLFEAVGELFAETSGTAPIVLVLDDMQWAGASDLLLLKHVVRLVAQFGILIVATYRDSDITPDHPMTKLLADLRREDIVTRIALTGLDEAAVLDMVEASAADTDGPSADAQAIHRDTAGNPFFIGELFRDRAESRLRGESAGETEVVPESVKEVIEQRLGRLAPDAGRILALAAVIGQQFELAVLEAVAGEATSGDRILDVLDEADEAGLIAEVSGAPDHYRFHHGLVRMTLCEGFSGARRRRVHRRVAESLEALGDVTTADRVEQLAYHWLAGADAADLPKAIAYTRQAGLNAARELAYESAAAHFERALEALTASDEEGERLRCDLLLDLGGVQRSAGQPIFRATTMRAADIARRLGDAHRLARAALASGHLGGVQWENAVDPKLAALYREAIAGLDRRDDPLKIRLMGRLAVELRVGPEREARDRLSAEALALARESGDRTLLAQALSARIFAIEDPSTLTERLAITAELEALCAELQQLELGCLVASQRFHALLEAGDSIAAEAAMIRCEALAARLRAPFLAMFPRVLRTVWALMRGDSDAEMRVVETLQAGQAIRMPHAANMYGGQIFGLRTRQGRLGEFVGPVRAARQAYPDLVSFRAALIFALCETDALEDARSEMDLFAADGLILPLDMNFHTGIHFCAESCRALEDARSAALLYPQVEPFATQVACQSGIGCDGSLGHAAGLLAACQGHWTEAEGHFRHALETNDRIGARPAAVSTRRAYATMLCERDAEHDRSRAAELVAEAETDANALGLVGESTRLNALRARL
jgi:hypothetical protein